MKKVVRIGSGFGLILVGAVLALPLVPGPGIPLIILGLVILSEHFHWARRLTDWGKQKLEAITPDSLRRQPAPEQQPKPGNPTP